MKMGKSCKADSKLQKHLKEDKKELGKMLRSDAKLANSMKKHSGRGR